MRTRLSSSSVGTRVVALASPRAGAGAGCGNRESARVAAGASSTRWRTVSEAVLLRAASSISTMASAFSGAESSPATVATICSRQSAADMSAWARMDEGGVLSFSQISRMSSRRCASLATPRIPRMFADPLSVCAARFALRSSSDCVGSAIQPCSDCVTSAACGGESCRKASISAASTSLEMSRARSQASSASGAACSVSSSAAPMPFAAASSARNSVSAAVIERQRHPAAAEMRDQRFDRSALGRVAQVRFEQLRPFDEERPHQHACVLVVGIEVLEIVEHAGADALHAGESHVAGGFRKPRDGRQIGIVPRGTQVIGRRELGCQTLELVCQRCEEVLSPHRYVSWPSLSRAGWSVV